MLIILLFSPFSSNLCWILALLTYLLLTKQLLNLRVWGWCLPLKPLVWRDHHVTSLSPSCQRDLRRPILTITYKATRCAPDPDFNAVASVVKVLKLQIVLSAGWRKFSIIQNHPYPGGNMFSRDWFQRQGNTHILQIQNECSSSSHLKMCRSSSFLSPPFWDVGSEASKLLRRNWGQRPGYLGWPWHKKWWVEVQDGPLTS